jgi:hypothetical protein
VRARLLPALATTLLGATCGQQPAADDSTEPAGTLGVGLRHFSGQATVDQGAGSYEGSEVFHFGADQGRGDDLCRIAYAMDAVAPRQDCADCLWAFDLTSSGAVIEAESGQGCAGLGLTASDFDGAGFSYGYAASAGSYESVLMYQVGSYGWYPVSFAGWSEPGFSYDWEMGLYYY